MMKRTSKKLTLLENQENQRLSKLPSINSMQFDEKFNHLLDKVTVQNRYANRISQCNIKNIEELEKAKRQLEKIAEEKKMYDLRASSEKEFIDQIVQRVNNSEDELKNIFKQLVDTKRQVKNLKKEIASLQKCNLDLEKQLLKIKRQKFYEISVVKQQIQSSLLVNQINNYLCKSQKTGSFLYQYCLTVFKENKYQNFFENLDAKIEKDQLKLKDIKTNPHKLSNIYSRLKIKTPRNFILENKLNQRYKTEHINKSIE